MIEIRVKKGLLCSFFVCDVCHEPITNVRKALIAMPGCFGRQPGEPIQVKHVHKGACQHTVQAEAGRNYGDLELRDHIASLLLNTGWSKKDLKDVLGNPLNGFTSERESEVAL